MIKRKRKVTRFDASSIANGKAKVPRAALRFSADVELGQAEAGSKSVPVTMRARSGNVLKHWYFGRIVHDFAGMRLASKKLPFDYAHDEKEVLGYCDATDTSSGELVMSGQLIPFTKTDRASEVIHKSAQGQPYQGSIYFDAEDLVCEFVPEGFVAEVNGGQFAGPGVIARDWLLRGAAVCPYGQDPDTSVQFSHSGDDVAVVSFQESSAMVKRSKLTPEKPAANRHDRRKAAALSAKGKKAKPTTKLGTRPAGAKGKPRTKFAADGDEEEEDDETEMESEDEETEAAADDTDEESDDEPCDCAGEEGCECDDEEGEEQPVDEMESDDEEGKSKHSATGGKKGKAKATKLTPAQREVKRYIAAFGSQGADWFVAGLTFSQAQAKFNAELRKENEALKKTVGKQSATIESLRGESEPTSLSLDDEGGTGKGKGSGKGGKTKLANGLTEGQSKFAATLKMPVKK